MRILNIGMVKNTLIYTTEGIYSRLEGGSWTKLVFLDERRLEGDEAQEMEALYTQHCDDIVNGISG